MRVVPPTADPEAELARLRRPSGPWLHLLDAAPADARQLGWLLGRDGVVVRILRGHCGRSAYGLFDEAGAALQLPGEPAEDWGSLAALLTDLSWLPGTGHVLVVTHASLLLAAEPAAELAGLVEAVRDVARGRAEEGDPLPFHLVLQDDAVGLAALRSRLDAVGSRHAELSGWDAEEPAAEIVVGARSAFAAGEGRPDEIDAAVAVAVSEVDGVVELRRAWEEYRGPAGGTVRVYAPVLRAPCDGAEVAAVVARAAAEAGSACVVVPLPSEAAGQDARQAAVAAAATLVWPVPPPPDSGPPAPAAGDAAAARLEDGAIATEAEDPATPSRPGSSPERDGGDQGTEADAGGPEESVPPGDRPGAAFELVAANLEWTFDSGPAEADPVDAALVEHAAAGGRTAALFRTWVRDPDDGWVRVVLAYVGPRGSIAEVEAERTTLVDALQQAGAARCCVEVLAASDVTDVHRWLEARCHRRWPRAHAAPLEPEPRLSHPAPAPTALAPPPAPTATAPTATVPTVPAPTGTAAASPDPAVPATPDAVDATNPEQADATSRDPAAPTGAVSTASPASSASRDIPFSSASPDRPGGGERAAGGLSPDAPLAPGPDAEDPAHADLLAALAAWAAGRAGVVGIVTAWTERDGVRTLVVGVALDGRADPEAVRAEVASLAPAALVEPFSPSRGLDPAQLRLARSTTRVWTRRAERAQPGPAATTGTLDRPPAPKVVTLGPSPTRDTADPRADVRLDGGFTLVGIDRDVPIAKGPATPDERDRAVVDWARQQPIAVALLRGTATVADGDEIPVYCLCVTESADPETARRDLAAAVAATGTPRAAAEAFAPAGAIPAFHLDLAVGSTRLWPT